MNDSDDKTLKPIEFIASDADGEALNPYKHSTSPFAFAKSFMQTLGTPEAMVMMRVNGEGMSPEIKTGDFVVIDTSQKELHAGKIYVVKIEGMLMVKRVNAIPGKVIFSCDTNMYPPIQIDTNTPVHEQIHILGQVVFSGRPLV